MSYNFTVIDDSKGCFECDSTGCENDAWFLVFTEKEVNEAEITSRERAMDLIEDGPGFLLCGSCFDELSPPPELLLF